MAADALAELVNIGRVLQQLAEVLPALQHLLLRYAPDFIQVRQSVKLSPRESKPVGEEVEGAGVLVYMFVSTDNPDVTVTALLENPSMISSVTINPKRLYEEGNVSSPVGPTLVVYDTDRSVYSAVYRPPSIPPFFTRRLRFTVRNESSSQADVRMEAWVVRVRM